MNASAAGDLVDGAVAAPRDHETRAALDGAVRELARVTVPFGDQDFGLGAFGGEQIERQFGSTARTIQRAAAAHPRRG